MFTQLQRKRTAKGFGVHSPFAFAFIKKVIYEKSAYYAYADIANYLSSRRANPKEISEINRLSFRLVNFFGAKSVLEIGLGNGINTLFLTAPSEKIVCLCVEKADEKINSARKLLENKKNLIEFSKEIPPKKFDALFADMNFWEKDSETVVETLLQCSSNKMCWLLQNINKSDAAKACWNNIKKDSRIAVTFDMKHSGIVILNSSYHKLNYLL